MRKKQADKSQTENPEDGVTFCVHRYRFYSLKSRGSVKITFLFKETKKLFKFPLAGEKRQTMKMAEVDACKRMRVMGKWMQRKRQSRFHHRNCLPRSEDGS